MANAPKLEIIIGAKADALKAALADLSRSLNALSQNANQAGAQTAGAFAPAETQLGRTSAGVRSVSDQLATAKAQLIGFFSVQYGIGLAKDLIQTADAFTSMNARLKLATQSSAEYATAQTALFGIAQRTATSLESNVMLYARMADAMRAMGKSQQDALVFTELTGQAMRISGASAESAKAGITQLAQAMASGVLRGDEFNSIMENSPRLAKALADGLNVPIGKLREMAEAGQLTADKVVGALLSQSATLSAEYAKIPLTVGASLTQLSNAWTKYIGEADQANGVTKSLAQVISGAANNLNTLTSALVHLAQAGAIAWALKFADSLVEVRKGLYATSVETAKFKTLAGSLSGLSTVIKFAVVVEGLNVLLEVGKAHKEAMQASYDAEAARKGVISSITAEQVELHGSIIRWQEYSAVIVKSAQDFAAMSEVQQQGYRNSLEGAKLYESAQLRTAILEKEKLSLMSESERKTIDYAAAVGAADAAITTHGTKVRELGAALKLVGEEQKSNTTISGQMDKAIADLAARFEKVKKESSDVVEALSKLKNIDLTNIGGATAFLALLQKLREDATLTGAQLESQIADRLKNMAAKDLPAFEGAAQAAFEEGKIGAQTLGVAIDQSLRAGLNKLGLDLDAIKSGFSTAFSGAKEAFNAVALNAQASGAAIKLAFEQLIDAAKTKGDVAALAAEFEKLKISGKLSAAEIKDAFLQLEDKLRLTAGQVDGALGDSFKRLGIKTAEAMKGAFDQLVVDFNRIKQSGQASAEGIDAAYQKIKSSVVASIQAMTTASREALQAAKDHTSTIQASVDAIKSQATAITASANAQKADAVYAKASEEAMKSGSAAAKEKAEALGVAAQAAHAAADAAQADAVASRAAAEAAKAEEAAKVAMAAAAANPNEWTKQAAADAQDYANEMGIGAENAKQAAIEAHGVAAEVAAAAAQADALASGLEDAADAMGENWIGNMAKDAVQVALMTAESYSQIVRDAYDEAKTAISEAKTETDSLIDSAGAGMQSIAAFGFEGVAAYQAAEQKALLLGKQLAEVEEATRRNEEATRSWATAMDSLRGIAASLKDELDRALGNDAAIEDRAYADKKRALKEQLDAAMAAGDQGGEARQAYQDALRDLDQLHAIKLADIAAAAQAKSAADQKNHLDELARIADEQTARTQTTDLINKVSSPSYGGGATSNSGTLAASVANAAYTQTSNSNISNTINISTAGGLSADTIRREIVPELNKILNGSR